MQKGIDISKWQGTTPNLAGLSFVVARASVGGSKDTMWDTHYANARKAGCIVMAYHYGMPASSVAIATQVKAFLAAAAAADFLWLDQEEAGFDDAQAQQFIDGVRAAGRPCGLYHSSSGFGGVNADAQWVADWRDSSEAEGYPNTADGSAQFPGWELWQYDGAGADGIDNDYANPASPFATLLRIGYVTKAASDAAVKAATDPLKAQVAELSAQVQSLTAQAATDAATIEALKAELSAAQAETAAAAANEKDRIAKAAGASEDARIRAL